jgi:hypothetical protein
MPDQPGNPRLSPGAISPYGAYRAYDIRSVFKTMPPALTTCLICHTALANMDLGVRQSGPGQERGSLWVQRWFETREPAFPFHGVHFYVCPECQWWYFREDFGDAECWEHVDYITVGVKSPAGSDGIQSGSEPWLRALDDENLYERIEPLPRPLAALFFFTPSILDKIKKLWRARRK